MKTFNISLNDAQEPITLHAGRLVEGRALIQGASGSGKSYLVRVIAEQTIPNGLQTIILDPEGEFVTLREKCQVLIAGRGGDVPTETRSAKLLARRIAETGVSAVVDLSDLKLDDRREFVRIFLETLDALPKRLEASRLVILDEAHRFCPESGKGSASSTDAVITLMSQGRKRGLAGILVTQRLSKLKKDAAAEAGNILIGRTSPIDLASAQDALGITKAEREHLRKLRPGLFFVTGPALSELEPTMLKIRESETTHPKPGARYQSTTPPPQRAIKKILKDFEELPPSKEAEEAATLADAKKRIRELERDLKRAEKAGASSERITELEQRIAYVEREYKRAIAANDEHQRKLQRMVDKARRSIELIGDQLGHVATDLSHGSTLAVKPLSDGPAPPPSTPGRRRARGPVSVPIERAPSSADAALEGLPFTWSSAPGKMLTALIQYHPEALPRNRIAALCGINFRSSTFRNGMSKLRVSGLIGEDGGSVWATEDASERYGDQVAPLPHGDDLIAGWKSKLGGVPLRLFEALLAGGGETHKGDAAADAGVDPSTSTFRNALSKLRTFGLLEPGRGHTLQLAEHVMEAM